MSAVETLLVLLVEDKRNIPARMRNAGFGDDQLLEAWDDARAAGYTEATGLGADRLTVAGRTRAQTLR